MRGGFALVAALWLLVAIAGVAAALQAVAVAARRSAINSQQAAELHWAGRGAIAHTLARLDRELAQAGRGDGAGRALPAPARYVIGGREARVQVADPRARVNVNRAPPSQLARLLTALGVEAGAAARLAAAIVAWRDTAAVAPPPFGDAPFAPLGRAFGEVDEVAMVPGMTPSVYRLAAPYLTVYGDGRVNVNLAPAAVLRSLPGVDAATAARIVTHRAGASFHNAFELVAALGTGARDRIQRQFGTFVDMTAYVPRDLLVTATVDGLPGSITALVRLEGGAAWSVVGIVAR